MPIRWLFDEERGHIESEAWGEVTMEDILTAGRELAGKISQPVQTMLSDFRDVTVLSVNAEDVHRLLEQDRQLARVWEGTRCAVIVERDHIYGIARMYAQISGDDPGTLRVFRNRAEGEAWLARGAGETDGAHETDGE